MLSHVQLFETPWTVVCQAPLPMRFSKQEYWSGSPFPSPKDLSDPGIKSRPPILQADSLPSESPRKSIYFCFLVTLVMSNSVQPCRLQPARLLCPWDSLGKSSRVGCHALLQEILPTQGSNQGLLHCRQILYH